VAVRPELLRGEAPAQLRQLASGRAHEVPHRHRGVVIGGDERGGERDVLDIAAGPVKTRLSICEILVRCLEPASTPFVSTPVS
jgi:hypothetical protein